MSTSDAISRINEAINEAITPYIEETDNLRESLADVRAMMARDDAGWQLISGGANFDDAAGLALSDIKTISEDARSKVAASSLVRRASELHGGYVFGNGLEIDGVERDPKAQGRTPDRVRFYEDPINQENLFSDAAKKELQRARFTDGNVVVFCDRKTKKVRRIPFTEITGTISHPDYADEIIAWQRTWQHVKANGETEQRVAWAYTNRFDATRRKYIPNGSGGSDPVLQDVIAVDLRANRQVGWLYGVPDALPGLHWATAYGEVLRYGQIVNESLAKVIYKVVTKTQKTAGSVGVKMRGQGPGGVAALGEGQDIQLVNSTQRSFDFTAARPLAAMAASAWNVSNIDLLSDSSAAGSSYGAAATLTAGIQNAMRGMQQEWSQFFGDVFDACGLGRPSIFWAPMEKPDAYRQAQELTLYSIALSDEEYRGAVLDRLDLPGDPAAIPDSLKQRVVDTSSTGAQAASPDQGRSSAAGAQDSGELNDQRSDLIGETLRAMQQDDFLADLRNLVERLEAVKQ